MNDFKTNSIYLWQNVNAPMSDTGINPDSAPLLIRNFPVQVDNIPSTRSETSGWGHVPQPPPQRDRGGQKGKRGRKNERGNTHLNSWHRHNAGENQYNQP